MNGACRTGRRGSRPPGRGDTRGRAGFPGFPLAVLLSAVLALAAFLSGCTLHMDYDKYAVVFGLQTYSDAPWNTLHYTDDDAIEMAALLTGQGFSVELRLNGQATFTNLQSLLSQTAAQAGSDDLFVFYFSGHGGPPAGQGSTGAEGATAGNSLDEYIALYNAPITQEISAPDIVSDDELSAALSVVPCIKKIVIIDACNSGGFIGDSGDVDGVPSDYWGIVGGPLADLDTAVSLYFGGFDGVADITPGEAIVLAAAGERESSYEADQFQNGVFTYFLLESATSGDRNSDGFVTVSEAYDYVRRSIDDRWNATSFYDERFAPHLSGGPVDYVLFTSP